MMNPNTVACRSLRLSSRVRSWLAGLLQKALGACSRRALTLTSLQRMMTTAAGCCIYKNREMAWGPGQPGFSNLNNQIQYPSSQRRTRLSSRETIVSVNLLRKWWKRGEEVGVSQLE